MNTEGEIGNIAVGDGLRAPVVGCPRAMVLLRNRISASSVEAFGAADEGADDAVDGDGGAALGLRVRLRALHLARRRGVTRIWVCSVLVIGA